MSKSKSSSSSKSNHNKNETYYLKDHYDNIMLLRDNLLKKDIEIFIKSGTLYCDHHQLEGFGCVHLDFIHTLDETEKLKRSGKLR